MRPIHLAVTAVATTAALGLTGCAQAEEKVRDQIRASCERAVKAAEDSGAIGRAAGDQLGDQLSSNIDEKYRAVMDEVVSQLPTEAAKRGIADGVNKAVPPEQRDEWRAMAVDVCPDQVASQLNLN